MSGVLDSNGIQWEHCNVCGMFTKLTMLGYQPKSKKYPHGRDICIKCVNQLTHWHLSRVIPAKDWIANREA
jgi:hypothetical protein